ncbi:hypothetical protein [Microbacterium sp. LWH7-1.2]|uniref:hypothetical protein n=1 Tax=Microbacterium sp. LWH7-1.2 TaxID=3135257 RepID=UPI00313925A4
MHGKTEAWYILTPGQVHLALARDLDGAELDGIVERQDTAALLGAMHRLDVAPGDVVHVPAGVLHAIGEGILLVELQEPQDLSILVEWTGFAIDGRAEGHLGVGFDTALGAVERTARSESAVRRLVHRAGEATPLLPEEADPFFRLEHVRVYGSAVVEPGFAVMVVLAGRAEATAGADGSTLNLTRGSTVVLPHAAGVVTLRGDAELVVCRPPRPR